MPEPPTSYSQSQNPIPDYKEMVRFLMQPFLDIPESLSVDCEMSNGNSRVWIRVAFEAEDKGRVFGRGGRNIEAIRAVIEAAALAAGQSVYLDIYGSHASMPERDTDHESKPPARISPPLRPSGPRTPSRSRSQEG